MLWECKRGITPSDLGYHQRRWCFNGEEKGWILTRQVHRLRKTSVKLLTCHKFVIQLDLGSFLPGWGEILLYKFLLFPNYHLMWSEVLVAQSCPTLCNSMDCSLPGLSVHGILQVRILEWGAILFSRELSQPRDRIWASRIAGGFFTLSHQGSPFSTTLTHFPLQLCVSLKKKKNWFKHLFRVYIVHEILSFHEDFKGWNKKQTLAVDNKSR